MPSAAALLPAQPAAPLEPSGTFWRFVEILLSLAAGAAPLQPPPPVCIKNCRKPPKKGAAEEDEPTVRYRNTLTHCEQGVGGISVKHGDVSW